MAPVKARREILQDSVLESLGLDDSPLGGPVLKKLFEHI